MPEEYKTVKEDLAKILAAHTSGIKDAEPEQDDFDLVDATINFWEECLKHDGPPDLMLWHKMTNTVTWPSSD